MQPLAIINNRWKLYLQDTKKGGAVVLLPAQRYHEQIQLKCSVVIFAKHSG